MNPVAAVELRGITKAFPGVVALDDVSIRLEEGSCHALVGENGAGKSTLGKILAGLYQPDAGEIVLFGKTVKFAGPLAAAEAGVAIVHQELLFCENLTVEENLVLHHMPSLGPFVDFRTMRETARKWLENVNLDVDPGATVGNLPLGRQQLVQIAGALGRGARIVIFDEPTSSLTQPETEALFAQIQQLKERAVTCVYVTHRMEEIFRLCDHVSVLRDGKHVASAPVGELDRHKIVQLMVGRDIAPVSSEPPPVGATSLEVKDLSSPKRFSGVSFELRAGEVLGLAGLVGSGRTEIAEALFGLDPRARGGIKLSGKELTDESPRQRMALGLGFLPEDRKRLGLVLGMNARENIALPTMAERAKAGFVSFSAERSLAGKYFDLLRVRAPSVESGVLGLSGGNQQKIVLAKWLAAHCEVLILDEPTRGVDVGAKAEIHELIRDLARQGKAILVISSELEELMVLATRLIVVRNGKIAGELPATDATEEAIMRLMTGVTAVAG